MSQIRVLHVLNNLGSGGAESFVMNIYRNIDRSRVQFDFLIRSSLNNPQLINEIENYGGNIYILPPFPQKAIKNLYELKKFFRNNADNYSVVHVHANALIYIAPLKLAKKYGVPTIIIHSHSTSSSASFIHNFYKNKIGKWVTNRFACSDLAGQWMFGSDSYEFTPNGIDVRKFEFNQPNRNALREQYGLNDCIVFGNVGRFSYPKNHKYLLSVFAEIKKCIPDSKLLLVGDGELKNSIIQQSVELGIDKDVIFTGAVNDVHRYYSAMDYFVLPSFFEGLPIALVEAQTNGLPVFVSDTVTEMARISDGYLNISIEDKADITAKSIIKSIDKGLSRNGVTQIDKNMFDVKTIAKKIENFYFPNFYLKEE